MKRSFESNSDYPNFSQLYKELNEKKIEWNQFEHHINTLFYEKISSVIPIEIWIKIFHYTGNSFQKQGRGGNWWTKLVTVSKGFYNAIYQMNRLYCRLIPGYTAPLYKFANLKVLTLSTTNSRSLILPTLPKLEKLRIDDIRPFMNHAFPPFPKLTSISFTTEIPYRYLYRFDEITRKQITRLHLSGFLVSGEETNLSTDLSIHFTSLKILEMEESFAGIPAGKYSTISEIHCYRDDIPVEFSGKCRIYSEFRNKNISYSKDDVQKHYYSKGILLNGFPVGEWKYYNMRKCHYYTGTYL